jgi:hypothetical protein
VARYGGYAVRIDATRRGVYPSLITLESRSVHNGVAPDRDQAADAVNDAPRRAAPLAVVDVFSGAATRLDASCQRRDLGVRPSAIGILCQHSPTSDGLQRA